MIFSGTSFEKLCVRQALHEGMAAATPRAPLAPERPAAAGRVVPTLFSAPMVRANIREVQRPGTGKTQTRRVLAKHNTSVDGCGARLFDELEFEHDDVFVDSGPSPTGNPGPYLKVPRRGEDTVHRVYPKIAAGDVLWVRETWAPLDALTHGDPGTTALANNGFYRADNSTTDGEIRRWIPSIHMPRWASRLTLEVTGVKVERLQDISEADAIAEGIHQQSTTGWFSVPGVNGAGTTARAAYALLWNAINGGGASGRRPAIDWDANPWVVAVTYKPHLMNVDAFLAQRVAA